MNPLRFHPAPPVEVWCDRDGTTPRRLRWRGRTELVAAIEASWRWDEGWWRGEIDAASRAYHRLITRDGLRCVVYRAVASGRWYLEAIVD